MAIEQQTPKEQQDLHEILIMEIQKKFPQMSEAEIHDALASFENMKIGLRLQQQIDTFSINNAVQEVVNGKSTMLDVDRVAIANSDSRTRLLENHGINLNYTPHAKHLLDLMLRAIQFIEKEVLPTVIIVDETGPIDYELSYEGGFLDEKLQGIVKKIKPILQAIEDAVEENFNTRYKSSPEEAKEVEELPDSEQERMRFHLLALDVNVLNSFNRNEISEIFNVSVYKLLLLSILFTGMKI